MIARTSPRAPRRAARRADKARSARSAPVLALAALLLCLAAAPADASQTRLLEGPFGSAAQPSFGEDMGLALDQDSGDLLVIDGATNAVHRFNSDGTPSAFSALGSNVIDAKGGLNCPAVPADCDRTPQNGFDFARGREVQVAIDESGGATDGNIYVAQGERPVIEVFAESGEFLGRLTAAGATPFGEACGVAVDPEGNVFVGDRAGQVHRFEPAATPPLNADHVASFPLFEACTLAVGQGPTAGFLFVLSSPKGSGNTKAYKIDALTGEEKYEFPETAYRTVTVDPASGHVIMAWGSWVREFDASGASAPTLIAQISGGTDQTEGVAVSGATERVYFSYGSNDKVRILGPLVPFPDAATGAASNIEQTTATLNGTVNPDGGDVDECLFQYGKTTAYGATVPCAQSGAAIGTGTEPVPVHANITGLDLGAQYHFRLIANNSNGESKGEDRSFKLKSPPVIVGAWAQDVGLREARLGAQINPEGFATTYHFKWGTTAAYGNSTPATAIGSAKADQVVSTFLTGLQPATTYHFRVFATNAIGTSEGEDRTFTTFALAGAPEACPNDALRGGPSTHLPDCRAYELVSPLDKNGGDIEVIDGVFGGPYPSYKQSSLDGERVTYSAGTAFGDAVSAPVSNQYISSRGAGGWSTHGISPPFGTGLFEGKETLPPINWSLESLFEGFTPDLCSAWVKDAATEPLDPDGLVGFANLYRRSNCGPEGFEALTNEGPIGAATPYLNDDGEFGTSGASGPGLRFQGSSQDLSHQVFVSGARLLLEAAAGKKTQLYDLHEGELELVSVLPNGKAHSGNAFVGTAGAAAGGPRESSLDHAISTDGSRIFWTATSGTGGANNTGPGTLYVRVDGEMTLPVSDEAVPGASAHFWTAAEDGSAALFTIGENLWRFDVEAALAEAPEPAELIAHEVPGVLGAAEDLSRIYFVSREDLAEGASAGEWNLYLHEEGATTLVATLSADDAEAHNFGPIGPVHPKPFNRNSRISPDGAHIAFQSLSALTGYDNVDPPTGKRYAEVFRYDAVAGELDCVSCNPSGARPAGPPLLRPYNSADSRIDVPSFVENFGQAATLPTCEREQHCSRVLSDDGNRVYFHSYEALVLGDTNGVRDVYQWEAPGSGSCEVSAGDYVAQNGGCLSLISTGTSAQKAEFVDASAEGRDVFFTTTSDIHPEDPGLIDLYDAREGGGLPLPAAPAACEGEACQGPSSAPNDPTPASAGFRGIGDPRPKPPGCGAAARKAGKLGAAAKRLSRQADRAANPRKAQLLRRRAARAAKQAKRLSRDARRCRRAGRGGSR